MRIVYDNGDKTPEIKDPVGERLRGKTRFEKRKAM